MHMGASANTSFMKEDTGASSVKVFCHMTYIKCEKHDWSTSWQKNGKYAAQVVCQVYIDVLTSLSAKTCITLSLLEPIVSTLNQN